MLLFSIFILITIVILYIASIIKVYNTSKSGNRVSPLYLFLLFLVPFIGSAIILLSDITEKKYNYETKAMPK